MTHKSNEIKNIVAINDILQFICCPFEQDNFSVYGQIFNLDLKGLTAM